MRLQVNSRIAVTLIAICTMFSARGAAQRSIIPSGFSDELVTRFEFFPTALAIAPDGRIFVLSKTGDVWVLQNGNILGRPLLSLHVADDGERGLLGIALHPEFNENGIFYLYYSPGEGSRGFSGTFVNRISMFRVSDDDPSIADPDSEVILLDIPSRFGTHIAGCLRVGPDRKLYISVGDGAIPERAQALDVLNGKILRLNLDGSIPDDNPFAGKPGVRPEIWAYGLRNPFRFAIDEQTGDVWIGDVGQDTWEELNVGIPGANYGWPMVEGPEPAGVTGITYPIFAYRHRDFYGNIFYEGGSITAGTVYRGLTFPPEFRANVFFSDWINGTVWRVIPPSEKNSEAQVVEFAHRAHGILDVAVNRDGVLFYVAGLPPPNPAETLSLRKIVFDPDQKPAPTAQASADRISGLLPLLTTFSSEGTADPEGKSLTYSWTFGDGTTSYAANPQHTYTSAGLYSVLLTVRTEDGREARSLPIQIHAGNQPPVVSILAPSAAITYRAGDTLDFVGAASDPQDGSLPATALTWRILFHHNDHAHPFLGPSAGISSGKFTIPTRGETSANTWFNIALTATDSGKLANTQSMNIFPRTSTTSLVTFPPGMLITLDGSRHETPFSFKGVVGVERDLDAPQRQIFDSEAYLFEAWSSGANRSHVLSTPETDVTLTARYRRASSNLRVKGVGPSTTLFGTIPEYEITIENRAGDDAEDVAVSVAGTAAAEVLSVVSTKGKCARAICVVDLPVGDAMKLTATLKPKVEGPLNVSVGVSMLEQDPDLSDNILSIVTEVRPAADLGTTITAVSSEIPAAGHQSSYEIIVVNNGPSAASDVRARLSIVGPVQLTQLQSAKASWCSLEDRECHLNSLDVGSVATIDVGLTPTGAGELSLKAELLGKQEDPEPADNLTTTTALAADLALNLSPARFDIGRGQSVVLKLELRATGADFNRPVSIACEAFPSDLECIGDRFEVIPGKSQVVPIVVRWKHLVTPNSGPMQMAHAVPGMLVLVMIFSGVRRRGRGLVRSIWSLSLLALILGCASLPREAVSGSVIISATSAGLNRSVTANVSLK